MDTLQSVLKSSKQFKSGPLGNNAFLFFSFEKKRKFSLTHESISFFFFFLPVDRLTALPRITGLISHVDAITYSVRQLQVHLGDPKKKPFLYYSFIVLIPLACGTEVGLARAR